MAAVLAVAGVAVGEPGSVPWDAARRQAAVAPALRQPDGWPAKPNDATAWPLLPGVPLGLVHQAGYNRNWRGRADLSAIVRFAATPGGLLVQAEVADDRLVFLTGNGPAGDHLRLFLGATPTAAPGDCLALLVLPPATRDGVTETARVADADRRELVPGTQVDWVTLERAYRCEVRLPWTVLPAGAPDAVRGLAVQVVDWDDNRSERAVLSWPSEFEPVATPPAEKPTGYQPPRLPDPLRPARLGELRPVDRFDAAAAVPFLPAVLPLGTERGHYESDEDVRVLALTGCPAELAAQMDVHLFDSRGEPVLLTRGDFWREGAVSGWSWSWHTPPDFAGQCLLAGSFGGPGLAEAAVYGRVQSVGAAYRDHLGRLGGLRAKLLAAATDPGSNTRRRRHLGTLLANLEDREQDQNDWRGGLARADLDRLAAEQADLEQQAQTALAGKDPLAGKTGPLLRGYVSDIDDTVQSYGVTVPETWKPGAKLPLVVSLHGYGFGRFHGYPAPSYPDAIAVAPYGRGNGDYKLWCERDILTVIDAVLEDYRCDPDRVYCTGGSMGGTGSWHMATLYPDRFAAIGPTASNANHKVWEEVWGWGQRGTSFLTPFREWIQATTSAFTYAENLRNVGAYALHGAVDDICPVGHERTITERLRQLGYDCVYEEFPDVGHGGFPFGSGERQRNFMFSRVRDPFPRHVTYRTSWHRYPGAYWVAIERFGRVAQDAVIDARVDGQVITVRTDNVQRLSLKLSDKLLDTKQPVRVVVDGTPAWQGPVPETRVVRLGQTAQGWQPAERPRTVEKNVAVGGAVEHAFMSRFLLVCGTKGDRRTNEVNRRMTEQMAEKWRRWGRDQRARVKMDWEVTDQDIAESNLICYGGPDSNRIVARVNDRLPIRFVDGGVQFGTEVFAGEDVGVKLCYPNPLQPTRYLCVFAGVTWQGTYDINGRFGNFFDWGVFDDRNFFDFAVFDAHTQDPETFLAMGYFDQDWKLDDAVIHRGDPALRQATQPRCPPDPLGALPSGEVVYLGEVTPLRINQEKGVLGYDQSFEGRAITLGQMRFERGLGVHPQAEVVYDIGGEFESFEAWVGIDLEGATSVSQAREQAERVAFQVYGDGKLLADTGEMRWNTAPRHIVAKVTGVKELSLLARALDGRKWLFGDAGWGLARLTRRTEPRETSTPRPRLADRLALDGAWVLDDTAVGDGLARGFEKRWPADQDRTIHLPGGVTHALVATGEIPDPYLNDNLRAAAELSRREWWLHRQVDLPSAWHGRRLWLELSGVTQVGEVWVNGVYCGRVSGPFAHASLELSAAARAGEPNHVAVRLLAGAAPWTNVPRFDPAPREAVVGCGAGYGLDGGGPAVPLGIHGTVAIRAGGPVRFAAPLVRAEVNGAAPAGDAARVPVRLVVAGELQNLTAEPVETTVMGVVRAVDGEDGAVPFSTRVTVPPSRRCPYETAVDLPEMRLWWPAGTGGRPRYRVELSALSPAGRADTADVVCGVRQVSVRGTDGSIDVNTVPVALRIAEWRPPDRFLRASAERCETLLRTAAEAGFNALRVWAGGGLAEPAFYETCDRLGLLVIQDLPLIGGLGRLDSEELTAAVTGIITATRSHPCVIAYALGTDLAADEATDARRRVAEDLLGKLAPDTLVVRPTASRPGATAWTFVGRVDATGQRPAWVVPVQQVTPPGAPPADLGFLQRDAQAAEQQTTPWPLTDWWRLHGGSETDLDEARAWLGPPRGEADLADLLTAWQTEVTSRQMAAANAAGGAIYVAPLTESWPRIGGALLDHGGRPRPGLDVVRRHLASVGVHARLSRHLAQRGDLVTIEAYGRTGRTWLERVPAPWRSIRTRILSLDGRLQKSAEWPAGDQPPGVDPVGRLVWEIDESIAPGAYLVITDAPGSRVEPDVAVLGLYGAPVAAEAKVAALGGDARPRGFAWLEPAEAANAEAWYLAPGAAQAPTSEQTAAMLARVRAGAGLLVEGPPEWLADSPLAEALPAAPAIGRPEPVRTPAQPEAVLPDHPALAGLVGALPQTAGGEYQELAPGAETILAYGPQRPLLVEGRYGQGRVLLLVTSPEMRRRLAFWEPRERFVTGLLAYVARLPHGAVKRLLSLRQEQPLAALRDLPPAPLKLTWTNAPLRLAGGRGEAREIRLRNDGATPMMRLMLRVSDAPGGVATSLSRTALTLLPGEERTVVLTARPRRRAASGNLRLTADGWGVRPASVDLPVEAVP